MSPRAKIIIGYIGVAIAAALLTGAVVWAIMSARLEHETERADSAVDRVSDLEDQVAALGDDEPPAGVDVPTGGQEPTAAPTSTSTPAESISTERQFCFVRSGTKAGSATVLAVDRAQILNGAQAAAAAAAQGDESPPPNDYYILNDDTQLEEFPIDSGITVKMVSQPGGGVAAQSYAMALDDWYEVLTGMPETDFVSDRPYWITIKGGTIVAIEEQFLP